MHTSKNISKIYYTITIFIYINHLKFYSLHKTLERMIDMGIHRVKESELDKINTYVGMYDNSEVSAALTAIGQMNVEQIKKYGGLINTAVDTLNCNKKWRKNLMAAKHVDSAQCSLLSSTVFVPMGQLGMGNQTFDVNIAKTKTPKPNYTVEQLMNSRNWMKYLSKKKVLLRLSRQVDVTLYSYILSLIDKIMPGAKGKDLGMGFNYIHALVKLNNMSKIAYVKALKDYKTEDRKFTEVRVEECDANVTGNKKPDDGGATPMPSAPSPSGPKKPTTKSVSVGDKSVKWANCGTGFKETYLVRTDMYRQFTEKKNTSKEDNKYNETEFVRALNNAGLPIFLDIGNDEWWQPAQGALNIKQLATHEINYDGKGGKLTCWRLAVQNGNENSSEMKALRKDLDHAGVKLASAH